MISSSAPCPPNTCMYPHACLQKVGVFVFLPMAGINRSWMRHQIGYTDVMLRDALFSAAFDEVRLKQNTPRHFSLNAP